MPSQQHSPMRVVLDGIWKREHDKPRTKQEEEAFRRLTDAQRDFVEAFEKGVQAGRKTGWGPDNGGISTRNLDPLPDIDDLKRRCQSIATLDAIISPEWEWRYYSFNAHWGPGEMCFSMRNGSGDEFFIHFSRTGALIKGFAHEYATSPWSIITKSYHNDQPGLWPGIIENVPPEFNDALNEPAFQPEATTFCIWRTCEDNHWCVGELDLPEYDYWARPDGVVEVGDISDADGSNFLLSILDGKPESYREYADEYFTSEDGSPADYSLSLIRHIYRQMPLTDDVIRQLNPHTGLNELQDEIYETIGYPRE